MSDPYAIWRAAEGLAKRKTVEIVFPELAAALGGAPGAGPGPAAPGEPEPEQQPTCRMCRENWATLMMGGQPLCALCLGRVPKQAQRNVVRRVDWTRRGPVDGWR